MAYSRPYHLHVFGRHEPSAPTLADFGLSPGQGMISVSLGGLHPAGGRLSVEVGLREPGMRHTSDRTILLELLDADGHLVDRQSGPIGQLRGEHPFGRHVQIPMAGEGHYVERLEIRSPDGPARVFEWPVYVPDSTAPGAAELSIAPAAARPGATLVVTVRNTGSVPLFFGVDFLLQRCSDEDESGWVNMERAYDVEVLIGYTLEPGGTRAEPVEVPSNAPAGRYRVVKPISALMTGHEIRPTVEFDVLTSSARPAQG